MQVASSSDESLGVVFSRLRQVIRSRAVELSSDKTSPPPLRHERSSGPMKRGSRRASTCRAFLGGMLRWTSRVQGPTTIILQKLCAASSSLNCIKLIELAGD
jgi:hypothetical protein